MKNMYLNMYVILLRYVELLAGEIGTKNLKDYLKYLREVGQMMEEK